MLHSNEAAVPHSGQTLAGSTASPPRSRSRDKGSIALAILLGFALPAFVYALVITRGTLDLFGPEYGWRAYNAYALSLIHGRTDVPLEVIGAEGFIVNGRVYMYYGMLPALARWPLIPFVDLEQTPVCLFITWLFCAGAAAVLQLAVLRIYWSAARDGWADKLLLAGASMGVWLGSGPWLVLQNGTFYHEPFAAGLLLSAAVLYLLVDDAVLQVRAPSIKRLCLYALLAGLAVFARQITAISLYAVTLAVAAAPMLTQRWTKPIVVRTVGRLIPPCAILAAFGLAYIWSNVSRFGGDAFPMKSYGYYILFGSLSSAPYFAIKFQRLQAIEIFGQFHVARIIPSAIYYLIGGDELRGILIERLGGGYTMAFGRPVRLIVGWGVPLLLGLVGLGTALARPNRLYRLALIVAIGIGAMLQLAYASASYRYSAELWPIIGLLMCFGLAACWQDRVASSFKARIAPVILLAAVVMAGYNLRVSPHLKDDVPDEGGSLLRPMPSQLTRLIEK